MKRMFLATSVAIPCVIALGYSCGGDDTAFVPKTTSTTAGTGTGSTVSTTASVTATTTATTGAGGGATTTVAATTTGGGGGAGPGVGGAGGGIGGTGGTGGTGNGCLANGTNYSGCFTRGDARVWIANADQTKSTFQPITDNPYEGTASLDGAFNIDTANGVQQGSDGLQNYANTNSPACAATVDNAPATLWKDMHWQLAGPGIVMGQQYQVSLRVRGVIECKTYSGGTGAVKTLNLNAPPSTTVNLLLTNATDNGDRYNTYALTVTPTSNSSLNGIGPNQAAAPPTTQIWNLNQCPGTLAETHFTWKVDETIVLPVKGGEWINYLEYDTNCRMICNCGTAMATANCTNKHTLDVSSNNPPPPTNLVLANQPPQNAAAAAGQWWIFDVTNIQ